MENIYLGRQPILGLDGSLNSYDVLYRDSHEAKEGVSNRFVSAASINSILSKFGTHAILGNRKAFVKVDEKFFMSDLIFGIPPEFFIFSIVESEVSEKVIERCELLKTQGYELAINDMTFNEEKLEKYSLIVSMLSYVKMNFDKPFEDDNYVKRIISGFKENGIQIVATKIENDEKYELAKSFGCELFQGYFFAKPKIFENKKYDSSHVNVLKLYTLLTEETSIDDITSEFEKNHAITVQLLQFINSGAFHFRKPIASIHHVLTLVGREPLAKWLMLMIYSRSVAKKGEVSPLMLMVKNRTELMEYIIKVLIPDVRSNTLGQAYFIGVLSLIDTVFGEKLEKILEDIHVDEMVSDALMDRKGLLGDIYKLVIDLENFNTEGVSRFVRKYKLAEGVIDDISLRSMQEVTSFENALSAT